MKPTGVIILALLLVPFTLAGAGATSFQPPDTSTISPYAPSVAACADFNGDGNVDLALAVSDGSNHYLRIMSGDGAGNLTFATDLAAASAAGGIVAADLNGDGITDLVLANTAADSISIFLSNGDGTFQPRSDFAVGTAPRAIAIGDFKGDGVRDDIAVVNSTANSVAVLMNDGSGILTAQASATWPAAADPLAGIAVGDFDGDDIDDIAVARTSAANARIFFGNGIGTFTGGSDVTVGTGPLALAATDLNNDGLADLAVVNSSDATVVVVTGSRSRTLTVSPPSAVTSPANGSANPLAIVTGDFNRDGLDDIAVANGGTGSLSVLCGKGDGTLATAESFPTGADPASMASGDLDGNGNDLLSVSTTSGTYSLLLNNSPAVAGIIVTPGSHDFGKIQVNHSTYLSTPLSITNGGSAALTVGSMAIAGGINSPFQVVPQYGTCGTTDPTIAAGSSCTVQLRFVNPITAGSKADTLTITASNAANTANVTVPLSGTVVPSTIPYDVTIAFLGRGSGSVSFSTGDAACTADCSRTPPKSASISLTATPDAGSYLYGWSGCDWVNNGNCNISFSAADASDRSLTVNFGTVLRRLMVATSPIPIYATTLVDAYKTAGNGESIRMPAGILPEALTMDRSIEVTLKGGYDSGFTAQGAPTVLKGITVASGTALLDNIILQ